MPWNLQTPRPKNVQDLHHLAALSWFQANAGKEVAWPNRLDGMFLVNRAKGIHKPAQLNHALSVRKSLDGPYEDAFSFGDDGRWKLGYSQEGQDPNAFTNQALANCLRDQVPVGVMLQVKGKPGPKYKILGLGEVKRYEGGRFFIEQYGHEVEPSVDLATSSSHFNLEGLADARVKLLRAIAVRRGQPQFRNDLLAAYQGRCAISGCSVRSVLEAAHIIPYQGVSTNHVQNGLLLRADLHTLFDLRLLSVDPATYTVVLSDSLAETEYASFSGSKLLLPLGPSHWPSAEALATRPVLKA